MLPLVARIEPLTQQPPDTVASVPVQRHAPPVVFHVLAAPLVWPAATGDVGHVAVQVLAVAVPLTQYGVAVGQQYEANPELPPVAAVCPVGQHNEEFIHAGVAVGQQYDA